MCSTSIKLWRRSRPKCPSYARTCTRGSSVFGVKVRGTRKKLESLSDEIEDREIHNLRKELGSYKRRTKRIVGVLTAIIVAIVTGQRAKWLYLPLMRLIRATA